MIRTTHLRGGAVAGSAQATPPRSALVGVPNNTKLALRVHLRLATCRNLLMRESRRSVEQWGLTLPQFDVLAELGRAPKEGFTFVELSQLLLVTCPYQKFHPHDQSLRSRAIKRRRRNP